MTLNNILDEALLQLGLSTDAQQTDAYQKRFTAFINDGIRDMAAYLKLTAKESIEAVGGVIDCRALKKPCVKVIRCYQGGNEIPFYSGGNGYAIKVPEGETVVEYRYLPKALTNSVDQPDIPAVLHSLLVTYVCYREYLTQDPSMQRRADAFLQMYESGKRQAGRHMGQFDRYGITNVGW